MAGRNGSGTFTVTNPDFVSGTTISSSEMDANFSDVATAMTQSIAVDGQTTITGNIPFNSKKITGLANGTASTDAVNKSQIDSIAAGLLWKDPVVNATTANVTLSGEQTIDGITTSTSRILVKDQTAPAENGIYVTAASAWARSDDADTWDGLVSSAVNVSTGSTLADTSWNCTADAGGTLGTTSVTYVQWGAIVTAGDGLTKTGDSMAVDFSSNAEVVTGTSAVKSMTPANSPTLQAIGQTVKSVAYTLVLADAGNHIYHPAADTTARIWTIPANASVAFPVGSAISFINETLGGVITIAITTDTLVLAPDGTTGSRSLAASGMATAIKVTATSWMISGAGLT